MSIADVGAGSTIEFLTSGRSFEIESWKRSGESRTIHDITTLATQNIAGATDGTTYREKKAGRVIDAGEYDMDAHYDGSMTTPILDAEESIRITRPPPPGMATGKITTCVVAVSNVADGPIEPDTLQKWTCKLTVLGAVVETPAA